MKERLDNFLVQNGFVSTRSKAQVLIKKGEVEVNGVIQTKPGHCISEKDSIKVLADKVYVGRGAYKLLEAIEKFSLSLGGKIIADCGASTGGFTQVCLDHGAEKVFAIDVGHDQLANEIKTNPKVINLEGVNLKDSYELDEKVDACVVDLSFISIRKTFNTITSFLKADGFIVLLFKPQFEIGREGIGKGGIVSPELHGELLESFKAWLSEHSFSLDQITDSPIEGKDGNKEYLCLIRRIDT